MIKVYEAVGQNSAYLNTTYKGIRVTLNFSGGDLSRGRFAYLRTNNRIVQDAIEADGRYGTVIRLRETYAEPSDKKPEPAVDPAPVQDPQPAKTEVKKPSRSSGKKNKEAAPEAPAAQPSEKELTFSTSNEAVRYLTSKGLYTGHENIAELIEKYGIKILG